MPSSVAEIHIIPNETLGNRMMVFLDCLPLDGQAANTGEREKSHPSSRVWKGVYNLPEALPTHGSYSPLALTISS